MHAHTPSVCMHHQPLRLGSDSGNLHHPCRRFGDPGKVRATVLGTLHELDAVWRDTEALEAGKPEGQRGEVRTTERPPLFWCLRSGFMCFWALLFLVTIKSTAGASAARVTLFFQTYGVARAVY